LQIRQISRKNLHRYRDCLMATETKETVVLIPDVEARGSSAEHNGIVSLGAVVGPLDRVRIYHKCRYDFAPLPGQVYEERCLSQFWSDKLYVKEDLERNQMDPLVAIGKFSELLGDLDKQCNVIVASDNPGFDIAYINYYLSKAGKPPVTYYANGWDYRGVSDIHDWTRGALGISFGDMWMNHEQLIKKYDLSVDKKLNDHYPDNDAEFIYRFHVELMLVLKRIANSPLEQRLRGRKLM